MKRNFYIGLAVILMLSVSVIRKIQNYAVFLAEVFAVIFKRVFRVK